MEQTIDQWLQKLPQALTPGLLKSKYRKLQEQGAHPMTGHCYVACEALHHLMDKQTEIYFVRHEGDPHWFLKLEGRIVDPTVDQFQTVPKYEHARHAAFLTKEPSKRARILMLRLENQ